MSEWLFLRAAEWLFLRAAAKFQVATTVTTTAATSTCNIKAVVLATAVSTIVRSVTLALEMTALQGITKDIANHNTQQRKANSEPIFLMDSHEVLTKAHELSNNGQINTSLPRASSPKAVVTLSPSASGGNVLPLCLLFLSWGALWMTSHLDRKHRVSHEVHISFGHQGRYMSIKILQS